MKTLTDIYRAIREHPERIRRCGEAEAENADMRDALDHIIRVCRQSRTQTRRIRWIAERAKSGLEGTTAWKSINLPHSVDTDSKRLKRLKSELKLVENSEEAK